MPYVEAKIENGELVIRIPFSTVTEFGQRKWRLTARQEQVLALLRERLSNKEIGAKLNLSERTVKFYVSELLQIADCESRAELIYKFEGTLLGAG